MAESAGAQTNVYRNLLMFIKIEFWDILNLWLGTYCSFLTSKSRRWQLCAQASTIKKGVGFSVVLTCRNAVLVHATPNNYIYSRSAYVWAFAHTRSNSSLPSVHTHAWSNAISLYIVEVEQWQVLRRQSLQLQQNFCTDSCNGASQKSWTGIFSNRQQRYWAQVVSNFATHSSEADTGGV